MEVNYEVDCAVSGAVIDHAEVCAMHRLINAERLLWDLEMCVLALRSMGVSHDEIMDAVERGVLAEREKGDDQD